METRIDPKPPCVVLASDGSSPLGVWTLILPWHGHTLVQSVVAVALQSSRRVVVVAGSRHSDLRHMFLGMVRVEVVANPDWESGPISSLLRGAQAVAPGSFYLALADLPHLAELQFQELDRVAAGLPVGRMTTAVRTGSPELSGHPVLFDAGVHEILARLTPTNSMMDVWSQAQNHWSPQNFTLRNFETPADYPAPGRRPAILVSGSRGSGKSEALGRLSVLLRAREVAFVREDEDLAAAVAQGVRVAIFGEKASVQRQWALADRRIIPVLAVLSENREQLAEEAKTQGLEPVWLDLDLGIGMPELVAQSLEAAVIVALEGHP